jgi:hypothetical protein
MFIEQMRLTLVELKESGAAMTVSELRKHPKQKVASKAKDLRNKWKEVRAIIKCIEICIVIKILSS